MAKMPSPFRAEVRCTGGFPYYGSPPGPSTASHSVHHGEDYVLKNKSIETNWCLFAVAEGTVIRSDNYDDYGNCVVIARDDGYWILYAHLQIRDVKLGQRVLVGQRVGIAGSTGNSQGRHLHIEVIDMRGFPPKWCGYQEHLKHLVKPSDCIDFGNYNPQPAPGPDEGGFEVKTWTNGSTKELVFQTTSDCKAQKNHIGSLAPREVCECFGVVDGCYLVVYTVNGTTAKKTGFVRYAGGVK
ncbi:MAG: M23 family metallopeptidase [Clostridia bacterium]|nr:M23 family metallopeptidase [Clostridia bacterium]